MTYSRGGKGWVWANGPCWVAAGTALIEEKDISWVCCLFRFSFFCFSDDSEQKVNKVNLGNSKGGNCFFFPLGVGDTMSNVDGRLVGFNR